MKNFGARSGGGMAKLATGIPLILLALAAWVVTIAGLSVVRHEAGENAYDGLGFSWFVIAADAFVFLLVLIHLLGLGVTFLANTHSGIVGLLAVITVLDILQTQTWNGARLSTPYSTKQGKGAVTAFAGFLSLSVLKALLILAVGNHTVRAHPREAEVYQTSNVHSNPVGAAPATATATHPV